MATKPESNFYRSVHRHLPKELYCEKMYNPLRGGTWDFWISGPRDLWVEYKWIDRIPTRDNTMVMAELSALQKAWGTGRFHEGRNLAIIVGCPEGGVALQGLDWFEPMPAGEFRKKVISRKEVAAWIASITGIS